MAVSVNRGSISLVSVQQEPYCLGWGSTLVTRVPHLGISHMVFKVDPKLLCPKSWKSTSDPFCNLSHHMTTSNDIGNHIGLCISLADIGNHLGFRPV